MDLRAQILAAGKKVEKVEVEEWGFPVYLRRMTLAERNVFIDAAKKSKEGDGAREIPLLILSLALCDEKGNRTFETPAALTDVDAVIADRLALKALKLNRLDGGDEIEKKSPSGEMSGSNSTSVTSSENSGVNFESK